jgi:hypothetical protein
MSDKTLIKNVFSLGYRCNSDKFLNENLKVRKYASPFSHLIIDIESALNFIDTDFKDFLNKDCIRSDIKSFILDGKTHECFHVHKICEVSDFSVDISGVKRICMWAHHNLELDHIFKSMIVRSKHFQKIMTEAPESMLLFYMDNPHNYKGTLDIFDCSPLEKYKCNFLILIPLRNFNEEITVKGKGNINIIYFKSILPYDKLESTINELYTFDIEERPNL